MFDGRLVTVLCFFVEMLWVSANTAFVQRVFVSSLLLLVRIRACLCVRLFDFKEEQLFMVVVHLSQAAKPKLVLFLAIAVCSVEELSKWAPK